MTTISQSAQSSYFPSWDKNHETHPNPLQAKRTTLVSFPKTRQTLWDSDKVGADMTLHLSSTRNVTIQVVEKTLRLAYQHAVHANSIRHNSFLVGTVETLADEEGITVILNRFDPGRDLPGSQDRMLTAKLPGDFVVPVCFSFKDGDQTLTHREKDFKSALKYLEHSVGSRECVDLTSTLSIRIHCLCYEGTDDITLSLHVGAVIIATPVEMGPINSIPIIPTALARNLAGPISLSQLQNNHKFGLITMDETRKLLLLLDTDPKAYALPLIGIWVSGVNYIHSPVVLTACLKFLFSRSIQDRALTPRGGFLLLLYSPIHKQPLFYECRNVSQVEGMTFDLVGCKDQLHLYKHGDGSGMSDVQLELTAARDGPSKELFLQTLRHFKLQCRSEKTGREVSSSQVMVADPHLVPRQSPKPTLTKSPTIIPSVPEVSIIFDNVENMTSKSKTLHPSPGYKRPGPLKDINQSITQLEQRKSALTSSSPRLLRSKKHLQGNSTTDENNGIILNDSVPFKSVPTGQFSQEQRREGIERSNERVRGQIILDNEHLPQYPRNDQKQQQDSQQCILHEYENHQTQQNMTSEKRKRDGLKGVHANRTFPLAHCQAEGKVREKQQRLNPFNGSTHQQNFNGQGDHLVNTHSGHDGVVRVDSGQEVVQTSQSSRHHESGHNHGQCPVEGGRYQLQQKQTHQWQHSQQQQHYSQNFPYKDQQSVQQKQCSAVQSHHKAHQKGSSPQQSQHARQEKQQSPQQSQTMMQERQPHSPHESQHMKQGEHIPQQSQHTIQKKQHSPKQSQHTTKQDRFSLQGQSSPIKQMEQTSVKQIMRDSFRAGSEDVPQGATDGENSAFIQLKKQEKMIEALQEQIRYLLQIQAGSLSPGLMTPPATPPSISGQTNFPFPSPQESGGKKQPLGSMLPSPSDASHQITGGVTSLSYEGVHHNGEGPLKQTATISTNTGQSLFFHNHCDYSLLRDESNKDRLHGAKPIESTSTPVKQTENDSRVRTSTTDSSVPGSVSDSALSADPDFQLDLENTRDDTESLEKVELTSYPDSGSVKSSPDGSPIRNQHSHQSSPSLSPSSDHNKTIVTPKMPTLVSPVLGESASTCQPTHYHHPISSRRTSPQGMTDIPVISEESDEVESALSKDRIQSPSLLCRDQRKFYQNLLGQVENFLQEDEEKDDDYEDEESSLEDDNSREEESSEEDEESQTPRGVDRSVLLRSLFYSPDFHPHINYVSLTDFGMEPSDISLEANTIAMKYLSDNELAKLSSDLKHNRIQESANPLLRTVLSSGLPPHLTNEKSMVKSRVEFSFATRKYLERHGLGDPTLKEDGVDPEEGKGKVLMRKRIKKKRKKRILHKKNLEAAEGGFPLYNGDSGGVKNHLNGEERPDEVSQEKEAIGNILDWNKLKNLPKLF